MKGSLTHTHRALVALILVAGVAGRAGQVNAGPISDQKKVYKALGVSLSDSEKCTIFTKGDAERVFRAPVVRVETTMDKTDCAYGLAKNPSVGVLVSRATPPLYPPHPGTPSVSQIRHIKGVGEDAYTYYANAGAGGVYTADVLTSKGVTSVTLAEKAGNADSALAIARMVVNR